MQLDAVEARLAGAARGLGEEAGEHPRQLTDVGQVHVPDPFPVSIVERLELAIGQHGLDRHAVGGGEELAYVGLRRLAPARVVEPEGELAPQRVGDLEIPSEESLGLWASPHRDEVEDLDEEPRPAPAPLPDRLDERPESGNEPVIADSQQGAARDVADAGGLHDQDARLALGESSVPLEDLR